AGPIASYHSDRLAPLDVERHAVQGPQRCGTRRRPRAGRAPGGEPPDRPLRPPCHALAQRPVPARGAVAQAVMLRQLADADCRFHLTDCSWVRCKECKSCRRRFTPTPGPRVAALWAAASPHATAFPPARRT